MTFILPSKTQPWSTRIIRRHDPVSGRYSLYRPCLRWEFGFSCAFCLVHEVDLMLGGISGWTVTQIEHALPQSTTPAKRDTYANCFYICERCNKSRGATPNRDDEGNLLLTPCAEAWRQHFKISEYEVVPRAEDDNAEYTCETYNLNDPAKVRLRRLRKEKIQRHTSFLRRTRDLEQELADQLVDGAEHRDAAELIGQLDLAYSIREARGIVLGELLTFRPVPEDSDISCRCGHRDHHELPEVLAEQTISLSNLLWRSEKSRRQASASGVDRSID